MMTDFHFISFSNIKVECETEEEIFSVLCIKWFFFFFLSQSAALGYDCYTV